MTLDTVKMQLLYTEDSKPGSAMRSSGDSKEENFLLNITLVFSLYIS